LHLACKTGNRVRCGYHGLEFAIPAAMKVPTYPVVEKDTDLSHASFLHAGLLATPEHANAEIKVTQECRFLEFHALACTHEAPATVLNSPMEVSRRDWHSGCVRDRRPG